MDNDKDSLLKLTETLQNQITRDCALKSEVAVIEPNLTAYCDETYVTCSFVDMMLKGYDAKIESIDTNNESMSAQFVELTQSNQDCIDEISIKVN